MSDHLPGPPLGFLLAESAQRAHRLTAEALAPIGVSPRESGVLRALRDEGPMRQRALGEHRRIDRTTVVALIDGLEARGLLQRVVDPADRRAHTLVLTAAGVSASVRADRVVARVEAQLLEGVPLKYRAGLKRALAALLRAQDDSPTRGVR